MKFAIKNTQEKEAATYKTLYIKQNLVDKISKIANENNTSFNNVIISMIESCLMIGEEEVDEVKEQGK